MQQPVPPAYSSPSSACSNTTATLSRLYGVPVEVLETSDGRLVVVGTPEPPAFHHSRHEH